MVRFTDGEGVVGDFRAYGSHARPHPPEGASVPVAYLPDGSRAPQIALPLYNLPQVLALVGVGGIFIAAAILFAVIDAGPS